MAQPDTSNIESDKQEEDAFAKEHIEEMPGWTYEKFQSIKLGHLKKNANSGDYGYYDGTSMTELIALIGREPDSLIEYTQYYPGGADIEGKAGWTVELPEGKVSVTVYYNKEYDQIFSAKLSGWIFDLH